MSLDRFVFDLFFEELQMCQVSVFITNRICNSRKVILPLIRWCNLSWPWRILVFSLPWSLANLFTLSFFFKTMRFHENRTWIELKFLALERINFALKFRTPRTGTVLISTSELCSFWTVNGQFLVWLHWNVYSNMTCSCPFNLYVGLLHHFRHSEWFRIKDEKTSWVDLVSIGSNTINFYTVWW